MLELLDIITEEEIDYIKQYQEMNGLLKLEMVKFLDLKNCR